MTDNENPAPAAAPAPDAPAPTSPKTNAPALIEKLYERRAKVRTIIIATVEEDGRVQAEFSAPMNAPALSHLRTTIETKLMRYYAAAMFQNTQAVGPVAGVRAPVMSAPAKDPRTAQIPRKARRLIEKAQKRVHKRQG